MTTMAREKKAPRFARKEPSIRKQQLIEAAIHCLGRRWFVGLYN